MLRHALVATMLGLASWAPAKADSVPGSGSLCLTATRSRFRAPYRHVDAPRRSVSPPSMPPEALHPNFENELKRGPVAKERLAQLLRVGMVEVLRSGMVDLYGRTLGDLRTPDGDVSAVLLREWLALRFEPGAPAKARRTAHWCLSLA